MKKEGHGKHINIEENLANLGKKDKQLTAAETLSLYPPAPRGGNSSPCQLAVKGFQSRRARHQHFSPCLRGPATQAPSSTQTMVLPWAHYHWEHSPESSFCPSFWSEDSTLGEVRGLSTIPDPQSTELFNQECQSEMQSEPWRRSKT